MTTLLILVVVLARSGGAGAQQAPAFAPEATLSVGQSPRTPAISDLNSDGRPDIAVPNATSGDVSILLGDGSGGFSATSTAEAQAGAYCVAPGDFDRDGKTDLAVSNLTSRTVSVLSGDGAGGFGAPANLDVGADAAGVDTADFNRDGKTDLAVANASDKVVVFLGDGAGGFSAPTSHTADGGQSSLAAGDINRDGKQDIVASDYWGNRICVLLGDGAGAFSAPTTFTVGVNPHSVALGDFNGDAKIDVGTANVNSSDLSVLLGDGSGSFSAAVSFSAGAGTNPNSVAVGDLNRDGNQDLVAADGSTSNMAVLVGDGVGGFSAPSYFATTPGGIPAGIALGDVNGDGKPDAAVANRGSDSISVLMNTTSLAQGAGYEAAVNYPDGANASADSIAEGDFNRDGRPDLAVSNSMADNVSVLLGDGSGGLAAGTTFGTGDWAAAVAVGDVNRDGAQDLAVANRDSNNVSVLLGNGSGGFGAAANFTIGAGSTGPKSVVIADFDRDGLPDLATGNSYSWDISVLLGDGMGGFGAPNRFSAIYEPYGLKAADLNDDGKTDLVAANYTGQSVAVLLGDGSGGFGAPTAFEVREDYLCDVAVGDFNRDGNKDLAVAQHTAGRVFVLIGDGTGAFSDPATLTAGESASAVTVADLNRDGSDDLVVPSDTEPAYVSVLLGDGAGDFSSETTWPANTWYTGNVVASDLNIDGRPDLVVATRGFSNAQVAVLLADSTPPEPVSGFSAIAGDERVDLSWSNPPIDFSSVRILRSDTTFAVSPVPSGDQIRIYEDADEATIDASVVNGKKYHYTIFVMDSAANSSLPMTATATPSGPTTLTIDVGGNRNWNYGDKVPVVGTLKSVGSGSPISPRGPRSVEETLADQDVTLWRSPDGSSWTREATATYNPATTRYETTVTIAARTLLQLRFTGTPAYGPSISSTATVSCRAYLGRPWTASSSPVRGRNFYVYGYLKPWHSGYTRLYFYRRIRYRGRYLWKRYAIRYATNYNYYGYARYRLRYRLPYAGRWYVRAYHGGACHLGTWSPIRYFVVR